jgi:hypothetical protein
LASKQPSWFLGKYLSRCFDGFHNFDPTDSEILQLEQHKKMSGNVGEEAQETD